MFPFASCQLAPASSSKPIVRVRKITMKTMLVRRLQMRYMKQRMPQKR